MLCWPCKLVPAVVESNNNVHAGVSNPQNSLDRQMLFPPHCTLPVIMGLTIATTGQGFPFFQILLFGGIFGRAVDIVLIGYHQQTIINLLPDLTHTVRPTQSGRMAPIASVVPWTPSYLFKGEEREEIHVYMHLRRSILDGLWQVQLE